MPVSLLMQMQMQVQQALHYSCVLLGEFMRKLWSLGLTWLAMILTMS